MSDPIPDNTLPPTDPDTPSIDLPEPDPLPWLIVERGELERMRGAHGPVMIPRGMGPFATAEDAERFISNNAPLYNTWTPFDTTPRITAHPTKETQDDER